MKHLVIKFLFLINHILFILHMGWLINIRTDLNLKDIVLLLISSIILIDVSYINSCNIRENKILSSFCGLLALNSWYVLLSFEMAQITAFVFTALSPIIWYASIRFIFIFLFQGSGYKFRKITELLLLVCCISSIIGLAISDIAFAYTYGIQFLVSLGCFLFIIIYHRKRTLFFLKSEKKYIILSILISVICFTAYYFATINVPDHIGNFGIYLPVILFFISVHGISLKEHSGQPLSTIFSKKQSLLIFFIAVAAIGLVVSCLKGSYGEFIIGMNLFFVLVFLCNIILGQNLKKGDNLVIKESEYNSALKQLQQEENLKTEFANFLHDDVLQDLLSIKNMMGKAQRPDVQEIITHTLENLNILIRNQMQDYHPVILKNLTTKENYQNLIESISLSFPQRNIFTTFECSDTFFLVEPYDTLTYRLIKELVTNVYKHSDGNRVWITLLQERGIIKLNVSDNGTTKVNCIDSVDITKHKGIFSIKEQVKTMEGFVTISDNIPHGICIQITLPMKGDDSYKYFVSR